MPAATHACTLGWYHGLPPPPPQELLTMSGRRLGSHVGSPGITPSGHGARIHCADCRSAKSEQKLDSHPFEAIHSACGATPIWLAPGSPSSPTMVPIVWVPWPLLSHGAVDGFPQTSDGSNQS